MTTTAPTLAAWHVCRANLLTAVLDASRAAEMLDGAKAARPWPARRRDHAPRTAGDRHRGRPAR
ncbi:hypothetical protein [Mycobacterium botniense]|uniref:hypothetical protein n=1 Tax=Mycobacterium botniense TaxID=84962 RepID=UPI0013D0B26C|nr:hypothetical protein [Mycobacterium botniense]